MPPKNYNFPSVCVKYALFHSFIKNLMRVIMSDLGMKNTSHIHEKDILSFTIKTEIHNSRITTRYRRF